MAKKVNQEKLDQEVYVKKMVKAGAIIDAYIWFRDKGSTASASKIKLFFQINKTVRRYHQVTADIRYVESNSPCYGYSLGSFTFDKVNTLIRDKVPSKNLKTFSDEVKSISIVSPPTEEELAWATYQIETEDIDISSLHIGEQKFWLTYETNVTILCKKVVYAKTIEEAESYGHSNAMIGICPHNINIQPKNKKLMYYEFGNPEHYNSRVYLREVKPAK